MTVASPRVLDAQRPWRLSPEVSLRDESFGALAYHHGNRRLVFLKSRDLVAVVRALESHSSAAEAIAAHVPAEQHARYERALASLVPSEIIRER